MRLTKRERPPSRGTPPAAITATQPAPWPRPSQSPGRQRPAVDAHQRRLDVPHQRQSALRRDGDNPMVMEPMPLGVFAVGEGQRLHHAAMPQPCPDRPAQQRPRGAIQPALKHSESQELEARTTGSLDQPPVAQDASDRAGLASRKAWGWRPTSHALDRDEMDVLFTMTLGFSTNFPGKTETFAKTILCKMAKFISRFLRFTCGIRHSAPPEKSRARP